MPDQREHAETGAPRSGNAEGPGTDQKEQPSRWHFCIPLGSYTENGPQPARASDGSRKNAVSVRRAHHANKSHGVPESISVGGDNCLGRHAQQCEREQEQCWRQPRAMGRAETVREG